MIYRGHYRSYLALGPVKKELIELSEVTHASQELTTGRNSVLSCLLSLMGFGYTQVIRVLPDILSFRP